MEEKKSAVHETRNLEKVLEFRRKPIKVIYVSSYIPRKCGIATYTKDLTNDINQLNPYALAEILAINRPENNFSFPWEVKFKINQNDLESYIQAANYINQSEADLVILEHEFGLYGGKGGDYIITFTEVLKKPLVITFHTLIDDPGNEYGIVQKRLADSATAITVMINDSVQKLGEKYDVPEDKIAVISHGIPDLPFGATEYFKRKKRLTGKTILGNINLLSDSKGIEYSLEAVAKIVKGKPNVLYLVIGQTHPVVLAKDGEKYRNYLKKLVKKWGIEKNVRFINEYLPLDELLEWLQTIEIYITPYLNPEQASSGALAYAIGAGKSCISTPYLYAQESLLEGRGLLVPFKDSEAIAKAVLEILNNPEKRADMEKKAYQHGRFMTWSNVALQHLDLFQAVLGKNINHKQ